MEVVCSQTPPPNRDHRTATVGLGGPLDGARWALAPEVARAPGGVGGGGGSEVGRTGVMPLISTGGLPVARVKSVSTRTLPSAARFT
jgi:hypothetical protein